MGLELDAINARLDEREECEWCDGPYKPCMEHRERRPPRRKQ